LNDQPREYITFIGPYGDQVRWFSTRDCRIYRTVFHLLNWKEGNSLVERLLLRICILYQWMKKIYFIALADGAVQVVKLIDI